jgi:hypothetical protein
MLLTEEQLDYLSSRISAGASEGRQKRKALYDSAYPNDIWGTTIPYTLDSSLGN